MTYQQAKSLHQAKRIINMLAKEFRIPPGYIDMFTSYALANPQHADRILRKIKEILNS